MIFRFGRDSDEAYFPLEAVRIIPVRQNVFSSTGASKLYLPKDAHNISLSLFLNPTRVVTSRDNIPWLTPINRI